MWTPVHSTCTEGCLACGKDDTGAAVCKTCDLYNSYRLSSNGSCFKFKVDNCEIPSSDPGANACHLCMPGFFLDNLGNRCSPVPEKFLIPDCRRYHWEYSCNECNVGFYLTSNSCRPVAGAIANCRVYVDAKTCAECDEGFFYHVGTKQCESLTVRDQCLVYSSVECSQCASGFFQVENVSSGFAMSAGFLQSLVSYNVKGAGSSFYESRPMNQCVQGTIMNCAKHESFDECAECMSGFFLSPEKKCESFPVRTVAHCEAYEKANTCSRCKNGFYLENNVCVELSAVDGCLEFDPLTEDCLKCDYEKFYLDEGFCGMRNKSMNIQFCKQTSETSDHCVDCLPSFQLTDDKLKCLPHIPHCAQYVTGPNTTHADFTNENSIQLHCATCADHFYLSLNRRECIPQVSVGCLEFVTNTNNCNVCASGYFKENDACSPYTKKSCKTMDLTSDACASCYDGFYPSGPDCLRYTARNCLTFDPNANDCATCAAMYYPVSSGSPAQVNCEPLTARNCKSFVQSGSNPTNVCADCFAGYELVTPDCLPVALLNCAVQNHETNQCTTCKSGYFKSGNNCKPYTVRNCDVYKADADECESCLYTVAPGNAANVFFLDVNKNCIPYTAMNCLTKDDTTNACATCPANKDYYINAQGDCEVSSLNHCLTLDPASTTNACTKCVHGFKLSNGRCFKENILGCIQYEVTESSSDYGKCTSCTTGFYLENDVCKLQTGVNCATFNTTKDGCATCLGGYVHDASTSLCNTPATPNCAIYDSSGNCTQCDNGYHLSSTSCVAHNIANCLIHQPNQNKCEECRPGFALDAGRDNCTPNATVDRCMQVNPNDLAKCVTCYRGFKMNTATSLCELAPTITDCIEYESNTGRCLACTQGKIPNAYKSACESISYSITNCLKYDLNDGTCVSCEFGYYLMANECKSQAITNCQVYKPNANECLQCDSGYFPEENHCLQKPSIANCLHFNADKSKCVDCDNGYYLEDGKCEVNSLADCKVKVRNENKCAYCLKNYVMGNDEDCGGESSGPDPLCLRYDSTAKQCTVCKVGYILNGGTKACDPMTADPDGYDIDPKCLGTATNSSSACDFCPQGNKSMELNTVKVTRVGCAKTDRTNGNCIQCEADKDNLQADQQSCTGTNTSSPCKQLTDSAGVGAMLTQAGKCAECRDKNLHDFTGNTCTVTKDLNVSGNDADSVWALKYHAKGTVKLALNSETLECGTINTLASPTSNCAIYDYATAECKLCENNYSLSGGSCSDESPDITVAYHLKYDGFFSIGDYNDQSSHSDTKIEAMVDMTDQDGEAFADYTCKSSHILIIDTASPKVTNFKIGDSSDKSNYIAGRVSFAATYPQYTCTSNFAWNNLLTSTTNVPSINGSKGTCRYWAEYDNGGTKYLACMGCEPNRYPIIKKTTNFADDIGMSVTYPAAGSITNEFFKTYIDSCKAHSSMDMTLLTFTHIEKTSEYEGLEYNHHPSKLRISRFIRFDSCNNGSLVVFAKKHLDSLVPHNYIGDIGTLTGVVPPLVCFQLSQQGPNYFLDANATTETPGGVDNCQIHLWVAQTSELEVDGTITTQLGSHNTLDGSLLECLSCKPGFSSATTDKYSNAVSFTTCGAIANCDQTPANNKWMNACQNCITGFGWELSSTFTLRYDKCVQGSSPDDNCLIYKSDGLGAHNCWVCKSGFFLRDDGSGNLSCVNQSSFLDCQDLGLPGFKLQASSEYDKDNAMVFHYLVTGIFRKRYPFCDTCSTGFYMIQNASPGGANFWTKDFRKQLTLQSDNINENCMFYENDYTQANCKLCVDDQADKRYVLSSTNECVPKVRNGPSWYGCVEMDVNKKCVACRSGYPHFTDSHSDKFCYHPDDVKDKFFCSNFNQSSGECEVCRQGYVHDTANPYKCVEHTAGDCDRLNIDGTCMSCVAKNSYPVNYKINGASSNPLYKHVCAEQDNDSLENFDFGFQYFDFDDNQLKDYNKLPDDELLWTTTSSTEMMTASGAKVKHKCVNVFGGVFEKCVKADTNKFQCAKCAEGYTHTASATDFNTCVKAASTEPESPCYKFYPGSVECEICLGDHKKDPATGLCVPRTPTPANEYVADSACAGNNSTDLECDYCPDGNESFAVTHHKVASSVTATNCFEMNSAGDKCEICEPGYDYSGTGLVCDVATASDLCSVVDYPYGGSAAEFGTKDCLICKAHYELTGANQCQYHADVAVNTVQEIDSSDTYSIKGMTFAKKVESAQPRNVAECVKPFGDKTITVINDCTIYARNETCHLCTAGNSGNDCTVASTFASQTIVYDTNLEPTHDPMNGVLADVNLTMQITLTDFVPVQCKQAKYITQIDMGGNFYKRSSFRPRIPADSVDKTDAEFTRSYPQIKCEAYVSQTTGFVAVSDTDFGIASVVKNESTPQSSFNDTDCLLWTATNNGLKCARCVDAHVPILKKAAGGVVYDGSANQMSLTNAINKDQGALVDSCIAANAATTGTIERIYEGLSYTNLEEYPKGAYISIDNCSSADEIPVVFGKWDADGTYNYQHIDATDNSTNIIKVDATSGKVYTQLCMDYTTTDLFASAQSGAKETIGVANCQIHGVEVDFNAVSPRKLKLASQTELKCLSCRPGYKATNYSNNTFFTACDVIPNCDQTAGTNKWMNACQTCNANHAWAYTTSTKILDQARCIDSSNAANCDILDDSDNTNCIMCSSGFVLMNDGTCVAEGVKTERGCTAFAIVHPYTALELPASVTSKEEYRSLDFINHLAVANNWTQDFECSTCETGFTLMFTATSLATPYYSNHYSTTNWTAQPNISNCKYYDPEDQTKCAECDATFVVVTNDFSLTGTSCQSVSGDPLLAHCDVVVDSVDLKCISCKPGTWVHYHADGYKTCFNIWSLPSLNCARFNWKTKQCDVCNAGNVFDPKNAPVACSAVQNAVDTTCTQEGRNGVCLKCSGTNYYPFHWKPAAPVNGNDYIYRCIDQGRAMDDEFFFYPRGFDLSTNAYFALTTHLPYESFMAIPAAYSNLSTAAEFTQYTNLENFQYVCMNIMEDSLFPNCEWASDDKAKCSKCSNMTVLAEVNNDFNTCETVLDCAVRDPITRKCLLCPDPTKHLNVDQTTCTDAYSNAVPDCNQKSPFADQCLVCNSGFYLTSTFTCTAHTKVDNCFYYDSYRNNCVTCEDGYRLDGNQCVMETLDNCVFASTTEWGMCMACVENYELVGGKCFPMSPLSQRCKTRDSSTGKCASCFPGYDLNEGTCSYKSFLTEISGCLTYDEYGIECNACESDLVLRNGHCVSAEFANCKAISSDQSHCIDCEDMYYLEGVNCMPRRVVNCKDYASDNDRCLSCKEHSYIENGKCHAYTARYCKHHNPKMDRCLTCLDGFFFDAKTSSCMLSSHDECQVRDYARDRCFVCNPEFYMSSEGNCLPRTVQNCSVFDPNADSCIQCSETHYMLLDNGTKHNGAADQLNSCKPYSVLNCQTKNPLADNCINCLEGFYLTTSKLCLPRSAFNCEAWNEELNECTSCPEGTFLSSGICTPLSVTNCSAYSESSDACLACEVGFYKQGSNCLPYTISDCDIYQSGTDRCQKCTDGFFNRNGTCALITQSNCATQSLDSNECTSCVDGYYLQNGVCLSYTISCLDYSATKNQCIACPYGQFLEGKNHTCINYTVTNCNTFSASSDECETCVDNHYYSGGLCLPYTVTNCKIYHALFDECVTCQENFYHYKQKCMPYNIINCAKLSPVSDVCLLCMDNHFNLNGNCIPYSAENCGTFHPTRDSCVTCESKMFYQLHIEDDLYKCKAVTPVEDCEKYEDNEDKCHTCEKGHYLDESSNSCHEVPETIANCSEFLNATDCKHCVAPYFLQNNECVKSDHLIDKCVIYKSNTKCQECEGANLLSEDSTLCLKITESSCATYLDPANCKTCSGNRVINYIDDSNGSIVSGLNGEDLTTRRAICNDSGINGCALARRSFPENTCIECESNYFKTSSSSCDSVTQPIDNCDKYFSDGVCSECADNHLLASDKKSCLFDVSFLGENCQSGKFFSEPKCFLCQDGHYFDQDGKCKPCAMDGCAVCTQSASASCRLCKQGYYMDDSNQCVQNGSASTASKQFREVSDDGTNGWDWLSGSVGRLNLLLGFFFILIQDRLF